MNQEKEFQNRFIEAIKKQIPERGKLSNVLSNMLFIEKEAVYRRLRGEVAFSFGEIMKISRQLNISLDGLMGTVSPYRSLQFQYHFQDYFDLNEIDYKMSDDYVAAVRVAVNNPYSEFGFASSVILPLHFSTIYQSIFRVYMLKWMYQFGTPGQTPLYSQITIPERLQKVHKEYLEEVQKVNYTYFIWDGDFLENLIEDIQYFNSIRLLTSEDIAVLKQEIESFLVHLEKLTIEGAYPNGKKVDIFTSNVNFESTYSYLSTDGMHISMISAFTLGAVTSLDEKVCNEMKTWMSALKRTSTLISGTEQSRILFFENQREILSKL